MTPSQPNEVVYRYEFFGGRPREVVRCGDDGIVYKGGALIAWSQIVGFRAFPDFRADIALFVLRSAKPRLALYLKDGKLIRVRGDILANDEGATASAEPSLPPSYVSLVNCVRQHGIERWAGPTEERILFSTAFALFLIGLFFGSLASPFVLGNSSVLVTGVVVGVLLAQIAFAVAPVVGVRIRRVIIANSP